MLRKATVSWTTPQGDSKTRVLVIANVLFDYKFGNIVTEYEAWASEEARARGAVPELIRQIVPMKVDNEADITLLLQASSRVWEINRQQPLVDDYSELDDDGQQKKVKKSLDDLQAKIEVVPMITEQPARATSTNEPAVVKLSETLAEPIMMRAQTTEPASAVEAPPVSAKGKK